MKAAGNRWVRVLALGTYACAIWLPVIHGLIESHSEPCTECRVLQDSGPAFLADCDDSCNDPSHHHHHGGHDHAQCMICQGWRASLFPTDFVVPDTLEHTDYCASFSVIPVVYPVDDLSPRQTRGPPRSSIPA